MAYTGYKIIQYIDDNPKSSTYGQTWTERVPDNVFCPAGVNEWTLVASSCQADTSGFTGYRINTYYNDATNEYSSVTVSDSSCKQSSLEEVWLDYGSVYCEQNDNGTYTGWGIQEQKQTNSNLLNYGEIRKVRVANASCQDETSPTWEEITRQCHVAPDFSNCNIQFDGTVDVTQIDTNPSSPTFNEIRTITDYSEDCVCEICDSVDTEWRYVDDYCGNVVPVVYQLTGLTEDTVYHIYRLYEICIIGGQRRRVKPTNEYSAVTYQTGVTECVYRWVDTEQTLCMEDNTRWTKYRVQKRQRYSGGTWSDVVPEETRLTAITTYDTEDECNGERWVNIDINRDYVCDDCDYVERWVVYSEDYQCSGDTKMGQKKKQYSIDGGETWEDSNPLEIRYDVIEYHSADCGYVERWVLNPGGSECSGTTKISQEKKEISHDSGSTWIDSDPLETRPALPVLEYDSPECGFIFNGRYRLTESNSNVITAACNSSSAITSGDVSSYSYYDIKRVEIGSCTKTIGAGAFKNFTHSELYIPDNVTSIGNSAFTYCANLSSCTISSAITSINNNVFQSCTSLSSINIPDSVTSIGNQAFYNCTSLTSIDIPDSVTSIGNEAFHNCYSLTSITIPDGVTSIGARAFEYCSSVINATIGSGVTTINDSVLSTCHSLTSVTLPNTVTSIGKNAFGNCRQLKRLNSVTDGVFNIPSGVTSIGNSAFTYCESLIDVLIPSGVTSIGYAEFRYCSGLTNINIPDSVTSIGDYAFSGCTSLPVENYIRYADTCAASVTDRYLSTYTIKNGTRFIDAGVFANCRNLSSIIIPNGVTSIGETAFESCESLTSIEIPNSVTSIGWSAFYGCSSLTSITVNAVTPPVLKNAAFGNTNNCPIYVPSGSVEVYKAAIGWSGYASRITAIPNS